MELNEGYDENTQIYSMGSGVSISRGEFFGGGKFGTIIFDRKCIVFL